MECCNLCNRYFASKKALEQHKRNSPVHNERFRCQDCKQSFSSNKTLRNHKSLCQASSGSSLEFVDTPLYQGRDVGLSSNTRPKSPTVDPSLLVERFAQMLISGIPPTTTSHSKRVRRGIPASAQETKEFFVFPELHQTVADAVSPEIPSTWFNANHPDDFNHEKYTHIMGKFTCNNTSCRKGVWGSKKVAIEIRGYEDNGYSAIVYNQRCKSCNQLGTFKLDEGSYIERVTYRLKTWAGVEMETPPFNGIQGPPHEQEYCEGCKRGKCQEGTRYILY